MGQIDFDNRSILIDRAWKGESVEDPKWGKVRRIFLPERAAAALLEVRIRSIHVLPNHFVFSHPEGEHFTGGWWADHFREAMVTAGFYEREKEAHGKVRIGKISNPRNLRPHSLRHSLNTILREGGSDAQRLRASMGWSGEVVQENYTHWSSFADEKRRVDDLFG